MILYTYKRENRIFFRGKESSADSSRENDNITLIMHAFNISSHLISSVDIPLDGGYPFANY